jgi:hypothetical protein
VHRSRASVLIAGVAVLGALFAAGNLYGHGVSGDGIDQDDLTSAAAAVPNHVLEIELTPVVNR